MATVRQDFFLDPRDRLTEQERALMTAMLADLLGGIADEIRAGLPSTWAAANDEDGQRLVRQLGAAGLLDHAPLIALLLRRADEERIASALRARSPSRDAFLQALIADSDETIAAAAMALILARGRRRDRLGQPRVEIDDLSAALVERLAHSVAAALRASYGHQGDGALSAAAAALIQRHEPAKAVTALTQALASAMAERGDLDEQVIEAAAGEGDLAFVAEALALRAQVPGESAWDHLLDGEKGGFVTLLRMADVSRQLAALLLASLADLVGIADPGAEIARFESLDSGAAERKAEWLRLDPSYRSALEAMGVADNG